jgi:ketosteroid isomerase-like protein
MSEQVRKEIEEINQEFSDRFARGDHEGVSALYTEDSLFLPDGMPIARGREQVRETFAAYADAGVTDLRFETLEVEDRGDTVLELARSTAYKGSEQPRQNYYVIVWHRDDDGTLRLHWDVVSTSHKR